VHPIAPACGQVLREGRDKGGSFPRASLWLWMSLSVGAECPHKPRGGFIPSASKCPTATSPHAISFMSLHCAE